MSPSTIPATHREVRLASRPQGALEPAHFTVAEVPVPEPGPGQLLVRNSLMGVAASLRTLMGSTPVCRCHPSRSAGRCRLRPSAR